MLNRDYKIVCKVFPDNPPEEFSKESFHAALKVVMRAIKGDVDKFSTEDTSYGHRIFPKFVRCVKALREETGCGLLEAKTLLEMAVETIELLKGSKLPSIVNPID